MHIPYHGSKDARWHFRANGSILRTGKEGELMYESAHQQHRFRNAIAASLAAREKWRKREQEPDPYESRCRFRDPLTDQRCQNEVKGKNAYCPEHE